MNLDALLSPVSEQSPCGPDLDDSGDNDYFNYTIAAENRLPERFVNVATGQIFDRKSIKLDDEKKQLGSLLDRSRDIRLLVLMAQFQAVAGDFSGFAGTLDAISALMSKFWHEIHPQPLDGDMELRRVALEALNDRVKVVMPLSHAALFQDRRTGGVSLRAWQVANKPDLAYAGEEKPDAALLRDAFSVPENRDAVTAAFETVSACARSLTDIRGRFLAEGLFEYAPSFEELQAVLEEVRGFILSNAADLQVVDEGAERDGAGVAVADSGAAPAAAPIPAAPALPAAGKQVGIGSHREAKAALVALETYFVDNEPSSPALILVHQARLLIGRPLVEALAALAPAHAGGAILNIDAASGFYLDMEKMKQLTVPIPAEENGGGLLRRLTAQDPVVSDRPQAVSTMLGIETFLSQREPSSPVSMLLSRARTLMGSNFVTLLKELIPQEQKS